MLNRKPMKTLLVLGLIIFGYTVNAQPIANAGPDQTIYLTQTNSATLNGSASSGDSYQWTDISTNIGYPMLMNLGVEGHPANTGNITSPTSAATTVTGLSQGTWYYQIAVTAGASTTYDTMVLIVDYDVPPSNGALLRSLSSKYAQMSTVVNNRSDTTSPYFNLQSGDINFSDNSNAYIFYDHGRSIGSYIDTMRAKYYSVIEDGYPFNGSDYTRSEIAYGSYYPLDSNKTYQFVWKGYFPQDFSNFTNDRTAVGIMQIHGNDGNPPVFALYMINGHDGSNAQVGTEGLKGLYIGDNDIPDNTPNNDSTYHLIVPLDSLVNKAHTLSITIKEGMGQGGKSAYIQVRYDGVLKYMRSIGPIGRTWQQDYPKFASNYDYNNALVDASNLTRNRKFALVTEEFNVYTLSQNQSPVANAGSNQNITLPVNTISLSGSGTDGDGTIISYQWTKISGPSAGTITTSNSASTTVNGLVQGTYQFGLTVTDNNGATGNATVQVTVNAANAPPTANAGSNQTITLPTSTVSLSGSGTSSSGTISLYAWTKISGPSSGTITSSSSASTTVSGLTQGVYQFQLTVTDNNGLTGTSNVQITVNAANVPPTSNAGTNQTITLPSNSVSLSGSGSDSDGTISSYQWTKISGPSAYSIVSPNSATTNVSGLSQGVYQFQLTVTDNGGAIGTSTVMITVQAAANIPPTANAGTDQTIILPANSVSLTGSGSDTDGTITSYLWEMISGPTTYNIVDPSSSVTSVTGLTQGVYTFQLTLTDNGGAIGTSTVMITVQATANIPPTANAGTNQTITLPTNSVSLAGSGSDVDGTIASYQWTKISGPSAYNIASTNSATTNITNLAQGVYQFQLTVTDNAGAVGSATVQVKVNVADDIPPTANAGSDVSINLPINSVSLTGSGSDADGTISSYQWTKISGPSSYNIVAPGSATTNVSGLVQGVYQFQLTVTDNKGEIGTSTVQVAVNVIPNIPPTANAGSNQTITLPTNSVNLSGSGSDADGTIASYKWIKISGPSSYNIVNPSSPATDVSGLAQGVYQFQLTVTDNDGAVGSATIKVTVNSAANIPPTANAGSNKTITLPTNSVSVTGSGSDTDGTITSYQWTKISGPSAYIIASPNSAATNIGGLIKGVYQFQLTVTDNDGAIGTDAVQVQVNAAPNIPPTANAGSNQTITLPINTVSLSGSGNDIDGTIVYYKWTKTSGPSTYNIVNASLPTTDVSGLVQGVYYFKLTVTDNEGAIGTSIVQVTVNAAANLPPTAKAGSNQTITLPTNDVSLAGSGSDADGTVVSYQWTKISGPSTYNIVNASSPVTDVSGLVQGVYHFQLTVTDNEGAIGTSIVQVTVNAAVNVPPTANAGSNKNITLPTNSVSLEGSGSDANGTIASYQWAKISGPSFYNIGSPNSATTNVSALVQGVYQFQLTVTDNDGATSKATVQITVNAAANIPPTANAGTNQAVNLPINTVSLTGSGSDTDGTIASYQWTKISGPSAYNIVNVSSPVTDVSGLVQGVYIFRLTVTDNDGAKGQATVQVTVNAAVNQPPTANVGSNQTVTLPTNTVSLTGSGSDADGTIASYQWTKISGPTSYNIVNASSPVTDVSGLVQGVYVFQLTVTDNNGASGSATVQITVKTGVTTEVATINIAPVANAGDDTTIVYPENSIMLNGSGTDADGSIVSYLWNQVAGPSVSTIFPNNTASTDISNLVEGNYEFELTVTDNNGLTGTDTVAVNVAEARFAARTTTTTSIKVYPNPVHDIANLQINTSQINTDIMIVITDLSGKSVYSEEFVSSTNNTIKQINMSNLIKGTYIITIFFDGIGRQSIKVLRI